MNESLNRTELSRLIIESLEGGISTERFTLLDRILAEDLDAVEYYNNFLDVYACLKKNGDMFADNFSNSSDTELDMEVWKALAHVENTANVVHIEKVPEETQLISIDRSCVKKVEHTVSKFFLVTAITSSAAMLFILLLVLLTPDAPPVVARLTDAVGVVWNDAELPMAQGSELRARNVTLLDGFAEVEFNDGAVVVIEAPAEFDLESDGQMFLWYGSISSVVPERAKGFTVRTPNATVVDYGTEFGVVVDDDGRTEAHVFKGLVDLRTGPNPRVFEQSRKLTAGQGGLVDNEGKLSSRKFRADSKLFTREVPKLFAREVPSPYEVAVRKSKPLAYWRFSKNQKSLSNLMKRSAYSGNYFESVRFEESGPDLGGGKSCSVMKLDGSGGYALIKDVAPVDIRTGSSSIAAWVRLDGNGGQNIVCTSLTPGPGLVHSQQLRTNNDGKLEFYVYTKDGGMYFVKSKMYFELGRWYHLVGVVDKTRMSFYIDGKLEGDFEMPALQVDDYTHINIGGWAGNLNDPDRIHARKGLNGAVAEVSQYRRALSMQEVETIYRAAKGSE